MDVCTERDISGSMDNESQAEGTKADDYSLASDHRKRKKVGDMSESGGSKKAFGAYFLYL